MHPYEVDAPPPLREILDLPLPAKGLSCILSEIHLKFMHFSAFHVKYSEMHVKCAHFMKFAGSGLGLS